MRRIYSYIVCLSVLLGFGACEEMFYREMDFRVEGVQEQIVVLAANTNTRPYWLSVYHTILFGADSTKTSLEDADVLIRLNGGEWQQLFCQGYTALYDRRKDGSSMPLPQPLDTVELHVSRDGYTSVSARQVMPALVSARIVRMELLENMWVDITLEFDPYQGNSNDMIGILLSGGMLDVQDKRTQALSSRPIQYIYSTDGLFAQAKNLEASGYYGGNMSHPLFFPASALEQNRQIHLIADHHWARNEKDRYTLTRPPIDLRLDVRAYNYDGYLYEQFRRDYTQASILPPSGLPGINANIMQEVLQTLSQFLGQQEPIPPFTNIEGGLGAFFGYMEQSVTP